jgi:hypothetical protein
MVTKQQAITESEFHYGQCRKVVGPKGGITYHIERWRANGACKTWKTRDEEFRLPIKYGLRGYSYLTDWNAEEFHCAKDCPVG